MSNPYRDANWGVSVERGLPQGVPGIDYPMKVDADKLLGRDTVNHPPHYNKGKVECIDALEAATADLTGIEAVCTANAIKYLWRWKQKGGKEDLNKAVWYIRRML